MMIWGGPKQFLTQSGSPGVQLLETAGAALHSHLPGQEVVGAAGVQVVKEDH